MKLIISNPETIDVNDVSPAQVIVSKSKKTDKFVGFVRKDFYEQGYTLVFPNGNVRAGSYNSIPTLIDNLSHEFEFYVL